jgi:hypothetical protein
MPFPNDKYDIMHKMQLFKYQTDMCDLLISCATPKEIQVCVKRVYDSNKIRNIILDARFLKSSFLPQISPTSSKYAPTVLRLLKWSDVHGQDLVATDFDDHSWLLGHPNAECK